MSQFQVKLHRKAYNIFQYSSTYTRVCALRFHLLPSIIFSPSSLSIFIVCLWFIARMVLFFSLSNREREKDFFFLRKARQRERLALSGLALDKTSDYLHEKTYKSEGRRAYNALDWPNERKPEKFTIFFFSLSLSLFLGISSFSFLSLAAGERSRWWTETLDLFFFSSALLFLYSKLMLVNNVTR